MGEDLAEGYRIVANGCPPGIASDWFEEKGRLDIAEDLRRGRIEPCGLPFMLYGIGYGFRSGIGSGFGFGSGIGFGFSFGSDYLKSCESYLLSEGHGVDDCEPGKFYLFRVDFGLAYVGRFLKPLGLFGAKIADYSGIYDTHYGCNWNVIAAGHQREAIEWRHFEGENRLIRVIEVIDWAGEPPPCPDEMATARPQRV